MHCLVLPLRIALRLCTYSSARVQCCTGCAPVSCYYTVWCSLQPMCSCHVTTPAKLVDLESRKPRRSAKSRVWCGRILGIALDLSCSAYILAPAGAQEAGAACRRVRSLHTCSQAARAWRESALSHCSSVLPQSTLRRGIPSGLSPPTACARNPRLLHPPLLFFPIVRSSQRIGRV